MKKRSVGCAALILAGLCGGLSARADCISEFFMSFPEDAARRNCWPAPFIYPARQASENPSPRWSPTVGSGRTCCWTITSTR